VLLLIGTAHVFDLALPLERVLRGFHPQLVALELDRGRWEALRAPETPRGGPLALRLLAALQARLGRTFGAAPGSEMLAAARVAQRLGARLALIDRPVVPTLQWAWRTMPWRERLALAGEGLRSLLGTAQIHETVTRARGDFTDELAEFAARFPTLQRELIDRRDRHMALALVGLMRGGEGSPRRVAAVVGEGHLAGMTRRLARLRPEVVPLRRLLALRDDAGGGLTVTLEG